MADQPFGSAQPPGSSPGAPQGASGGSFGSTPSPTSVPNQGQAAAGLQVLAVIQKLILMGLNQVGPSSPAGTDLRKALDLISKHVPAGAVSPAGQKNVMDGLQARMQQQNPQIAQMQQMAARQMGGGAQPPAQAA